MSEPGCDASKLRRETHPVPNAVGLGAETTNISANALRLFGLPTIIRTEDAAPGAILDGDLTLAEGAAIRGLQCPARPIQHVISMIPEPAQFSGFDAILSAGDDTPPRAPAPCTLC
jgi:hypothetical protein